MPNVYLVMFSSNYIGLNAHIMCLPTVGLLLLTQMENRIPQQRQSLSMMVRITSLYLFIVNSNRQGRRITMLIILGKSY